MLASICTFWNWILLILFPPSLLYFVWLNTYMILCSSHHICLSLNDEVLTFPIKSFILNITLHVYLLLSAKAYKMAALNHHFNASVARCIPMFSLAAVIPVNLAAWYSLLHNRIISSVELDTVAYLPYAATVIKRSRLLGQYFKEVELAIVLYWFGMLLELNPYIGRHFKGTISLVINRPLNKFNLPKTCIKMSFRFIFNSPQH